MKIEELKKEIKNLQIKSSSWMTVFDWEAKKKELERLEKDSKNEKLWSDHEKMGVLMKKIEILRKEIDDWNELKRK